MGSTKYPENCKYFIRPIVGYGWTDNLTMVDTDFSMDKKLEEAKELISTQI